MAIDRPDFLKWVVLEPDNWHLKDGAPDWVKEEFEKFIKLSEENR